MTRRSRALVGFGGLAVLALAAFGTPSATATPVGEADDNTEPAPDPDVDATADGTFEACTENFGLGKVVEIVVEVDGSVPVPPLTYPEDVVVVADVDFGSGVQTCLPEPVTAELWETNSLWGVEFGIPPPVGNFVFLPVEEQDPCAQQPAYTLRLVGAPPGFDVTVVQAVVPPSSELLCDSGFPFALEAAEPLMPPEAFAALTNFVENEGDAEGCDTSDTPNEDLTTAWDALVDSFSGPFLDLYEGEIDGETDCEQVELAFIVFAIQVAYEAEVGRQAVFALATPASTPASDVISVVPVLAG